MTEYLAIARTENDSHRELTMLASSPEEAERLFLDEAKAKNLRLRFNQDTGRVKFWASIHLEERKPLAAASAGFSLIELLIVVAIILIIAAIAIPNLLKSRQAANNSQAAANVKAIDTAIQQFSTTCSGQLPASLQAIATTSATWAEQSGGTCTAEGQAGVGGLLPSSFLTQPVGSFTYTVNVDGATTDGGYTVTAVCTGFTCSDAFYKDGNGLFTHAGDGSGTTAPTATSLAVGQ